MARVSDETMVMWAEKLAAWGKEVEEWHSIHYPAQTCETCASSGPEIDAGKARIACGCWEFEMTPDEAHKMGCYRWEANDGEGE